MASSDTFVIVGAGLAGARSAEALRDQGFDGRLVLIGAEQHLPYDRPPLSKGYLAGTTDRAKVFLKPDSWYAEHAVELRLDAPVRALDPAARRLELAAGDAVGYDRLVLATGASPRPLDVPGAQAAGVHYLRSIEDSEALGELIGRVSRLAVIGAGWIGLEVSAAARQAGVAVSVIETAELPLLRVLGTEIAAVFADLHREHGVDFHFGASVAEILTDQGRASGVRLGDGSVLAADAVLVAVGASPNSALAEAAGLAVDNGVLVDQALRTSDPAVFAVGDVASALHPFYGKHIRVEHWANALKQPATAAASMLDQAASYDDLPYFYTDQYDLGMEYVGHTEPGGYDRVLIRGDVRAREFIAFWLAGGRVLAGMNVNVWDVADPIKALIRSRAVIDVDALADQGTDLAELANQA